jgi:hypothetical protein
MAEEFSPHRADQALHEWVGQGHMRYGLAEAQLTTAAAMLVPVIAA